MQAAPVRRMPGTPAVRYRQNGGNTPVSRLQETLGTPEGQGRIKKFLEATGTADSAGFVRGVFFVSGASVPEGDSLPVLIRNMVAGGYTPVPVFLDPPQAGDLFVACDPAGTPLEVGFVVKTPKEQPEEPYFMSFDVARGYYRRTFGRDAEAVAFWLRPG
jgi:hypothetical protein